MKKYLLQKMSSLITRSKSVPYTDLFPMDSNSIENLIKEGLSLTIEDHAFKTYQIVHNRFDNLAKSFINIMKNYCPYTEVYQTQGCHLTWKTGKTLKNLEFDNLGKNNLKKPGILTIFTGSVVKFRFDSKNLSYKIKNLCHHQILFFIKKTYLK